MPETLTVFTCPKAFVGVTGVQQRNAIRSWQRLGSDVDVVLVGDDAGTDVAASQLAVRHVASIERNEQGTPLVSSVFRLGLAASGARVVCYVNSDILLVRDFLDAVRSLAGSRFLMCGRRWDIDLNSSLDFENRSWQTELRKTVAERGRLHASTGIDYFVFTRGLFDRIPPFAIGRALYDNWLIFHTLARGAPVIDASERVTAIHQNHSYHHVPDGIEGAWFGPEAQHNRRLAEDMLVPFTIDDASLRLTAYGLQRNLSRSHLTRLPLVYAALELRNHARLRKYVRSAGRAVLTRASTWK